MKHGESYRIDSDSFPTLFSKANSLTNITQDLVNTTNTSPSSPLKDRVKLLESQKQRLEIDLQANTHRFRGEKEFLQSKISSLELSESQLKHDLSTLRQDLNKSRDRSQEFSEKLLFFESQVEFLTKENKRLNDQHKIDKENWELKLESLKKSKPDSQETIKLNLLLSKSEAKVLSLTSELEELKTKIDYQKTSYQQKLEYVQSEVSKLKAEREKYIKDLESKNKDNEDIIHRLKIRIKEIESKLSSKKKPVQKKPEKSLSLSESFSKSSKSPLVNSPNRKPANPPSVSSIKSSDSSKSLKKKPSRESSCEKPPIRIHNKAPSYLRKENQSTSIDLLEKEIAVLTGRYKYLMQMSQEASELQSLKTEITKVATEIEAKSNSLFALKKKQKEFLMQQVSH